MAFLTLESLSRVITNFLKLVDAREETLCKMFYDIGLIDVTDSFPLYK